MKKIFLSLILSSVLLTACEGFLSELPTKSSTDPLETVEQLRAVLDNPNYRAVCYAAAFSNDDCEVSYDIVDQYTSFGVAGLYHYTFNVEDVENEAEDALWTQHYGTIYRANLVIENVDKVSGDPAEKARVKAEAHFYRAYLYWELANSYCMPYAAGNMNELGLPKRITTSMEEDYARTSLAETYAQIDRDIAEALKIDKTARDYAWRSSKAAVQAFLSRYYLHRCEYDKAVEAADFALNNLGQTALKDYNTLQATVGVNGGSELQDISSSNVKLTNWQEFFFMRFAYLSSQWFTPSQDLIALYDQTNDMRYKWFFTNPNPRFGQTLQLPDDCRYNVFSDGAMLLCGPTIQEVMLNRAEALVRRSNPDIAGAMNQINKLREYRIAPHAGRDLSASTKEDALKKILDERRRELAFAHRWWDIRRFAYNETPDDDVAITREFYVVTMGSIDRTQVKQYSLPVGSRRYAVPINGVNIDSSKGTLVQNEY
ncbi:MAG: RagB/SusD family nutrient uptake outer membrane protein [Prevotellaceae bacterium]|jgi:hypothetical protein|nr:RagB/SusD family nutrient uptake outer membrane protein [Prevotellaceae bacterium]